MGIRTRAMPLAACSADVSSTSSAAPSEVAATEPTPEVTSTPRPTVRPRSTPRPTPTPDPRDEIALVDYGFSTYHGEFDDGASLTWAVVLENPNASWLATRVNLNVSFLDDAGSIVTTASDTVALILPGEQSATVGSDSYFSNPDLGTITSMEVQLGSADWEEPDGPVGEFTITDIATRTGEFGQVTTTARVNSTFADEITNPKAVVVYYDADGAVLGGDFTFVDFVPAGGTIPVEISGFDAVPGLSSSDIFITFSFLSL